MQPSFVASLLRTSADGLAGLAATRLIDEDGPGPVAELGGFDAWRAQLRVLILELAAAVEDEAPDLFAAHIAWVHEAFSARRSEPGPLLVALERLGEVLTGSLPEVAAHTLPKYLEAARRELLSPSHARPSELGGSGEHVVLARAWLEFMLAGDERAALDLLFGALARGEIDARRAITGVLAPVMREIGRAWHAGEIGVGQEHFATSVSRGALARLVALAPRRAPNGCTVVLTSVAGDAHDLAIQIVATFFDLDGWRVLSLGANTPPDVVVEVARRNRADLLVLAATLSPQRETAARTIALSRELERPPRIIVGGHAFDSTRELWRRAGADARAATAEDALRLGRELVGLPAEQPAE